MPFRYDVFLSHSSADKPAVEFLARKLEAAGIKVFFDKWHLIPGEPWEESLEQALKESRTCAAFLGPGELRPWQDEEIRVALDRRARKQMLRVIPVLLPDSFPPREEDLPLFLSRLTWVDFRNDLDGEAAFQDLVRGINGESLNNGGEGESIKPLRSKPYRCMIQRPEGYVSRQEYELVIEALLSGDQDSRSVGITTALQGAGGFGKTFLAQQICFDDRVRERFPDGILWTIMGEDISLEGRLSRIRDLIRWWTDKEAPAFETVTAAGAKLRELLAASRVLIVVDDVWNPSDVPPFQGLENGSALLITTRDQQTLPRDSEKILVDAMVSREAVQLLRSGLPDGLDRDFEWLAADLGEWPLLLGLVNRQLRELVRDGLRFSRALKEVREALAQGFSAFDRDDPDSRHAAASKAILVSIQRLSEKERKLYFRLAVFPEDVNIPMNVLQRLWGIDGLHVRRFCHRLFELSLLRELEVQQETIRLHDVIRKVLVEQSGKELTETHQEFLESFQPANGAWWEVENGESYFWTFLSYHFLEAGWRKDLRELLLCFSFIKAKLEATDVNVLIGDYESFFEEELRLVQAALRLSKDFLFRDSNQLASQLWGRLVGINARSIRGLLEDAQASQTTTWLRPRIACLTPPRVLIRTLECHTDRVNSVLVVDGHRAVSASVDGTLRVWDLDSGKTLHTLQGHTDRVRSVSVVDGRRAVSASADGTLRVWDLDRGQTLYTLRGHMGKVWSVSAVDGHRAVSASADGTLRVWDLNSRETLHTLRGHTGGVWSVAVVDGRRAVSASYDGTLRVWNLSSGQTLHILLGHTAGVNSVSMVDDCRAVSASVDRTLRVWDLNSGQTLHTLQGHTDWVWSVSVADGGRAVSTSDDGTLRVWDLNNGQPLHTLKGNIGWVTSVLLVDGHRAVSASEDQTLRVWDLETGEEISMMTLDEPVWALAYSVERKIVVAGDRAGKVHFFDLVEPE